MKKDYGKLSVQLHKKYLGKLSISAKTEINNIDDLATVYSPGVAEPCKQIVMHSDLVYKMTMKANSVAVVSDGSAVLGLGNIGAEAAIPVMEGKAILFKKYANIDAFPICLKTQDAQELINTIINISPSFGGINLEDISAPRCFKVEESLQDIGIPVFHDDQHGTAIVVIAALINAAKVSKKNFNKLKIVINGAGAAGKAILDMFRAMAKLDDNYKVKDIIICDSKGIVQSRREDVAFNKHKNEIAMTTNKDCLKGKLATAMVGADVFIGVSLGNLVNIDMVRTMAKDPIIFALANPIPEIFPEIAKKGGAIITATGRSDYKNQVNNVLAFPGIFRGALDVRAKKITTEMKIAAAFALAKYTKNPKPDYIIPSPLDIGVAKAVAQAVAKAV